MSKPSEIRPIALFLICWLATFAVLFPHGVVVCIGEPAHVELGIIGSTCCDEDSRLATALAFVSAGLPDNTCTDGDHVLATSWHHPSNRDLSKSFGRSVTIQSQAVRVLPATFGNLHNESGGARHPVADPIPPLLLEHLSTLILIC
jgi:hypothetical protein